MRGVLAATRTITQLWLVDPVRRGRPQLHGLGRVVAAVSVVAAGVYGALLTLTLASGWLPTGESQTWVDLVGMSVVALALVCALLAVATTPQPVARGLACLPPLVWAVGWALTLVGRDEPVGAAVELAVVLGLCGVLLMPGREHPSVPRTVGVTVLGVLTMGLPWAWFALLTPSFSSGRLIGYTMGFTFGAVTGASLPAIYMAGAELSEVAVSLAQATTVAVSHRVPRGLWPVLATVLVLANLVVVLPEPALVRPWIRSGLALGLSLAVGELLLRLARTRRPQRAPAPAMLTSRLSALWPVALCLACWHPLAVASIAVPWLDPWYNAIAFTAAGVVALVQSMRRAGSGDAAGTLLLNGIGWTLLVAGFEFRLRVLGGIGQREASVIATLVLVAATVRWIGRGGLDPHRWACLCLGWLICLLLPWRDLIAEPLQHLLELSGEPLTGLAAALMGLLWLVLTEARWTRHGSPTMPRTTRMLLFLAYALLVATAVFAARFRSHIHQPTGSVGIASGFFGVGMLPGLVLGLIELGRFRISPVAQESRPSS